MRGRVKIVERRALLKNEAYFMRYFVESLREVEGFIMDSADLSHHISKVR